jgi:hypothetical protein
VLLWYTSMHFYGRITSTNQGNLCVSSNPPSIAALTNSVCKPFPKLGAV